MRDVAIDALGHARTSRLDLGHRARRRSASALDRSRPDAARSPLLGLGIAMVFIGVFVLGPLIARPLRACHRRAAARLRGIAGRLAQENAMRNPKRTARTAAALMVGVALVAGISVLAASIKASVRNIFEQAVHRRLRGRAPTATASAAYPHRRPPAQPAARGATPPPASQLGAAKIDGSPQRSASSIPRPPARSSTSTSSQGSISDLNDQTVLISKCQADSEHLESATRDDDAPQRHDAPR